ncbi:MAG: ATP-binding cassette domain-containing protein [Planctomycetota bacterium]|nr:MAG: ATP-binding cassette domain-containing protein [Planctomycetota bacterium]
MPPALELRGITKRFGNILALDNVDFSVPAGSVTALVGENGAGKTTLVGIAAGAVRPDSGEINAGGETLALSRPLDALSRGVGLVYQHTRLVDDLSCAENVALGVPPSRCGIISRDKLSEKVSQLFDRLRLDRGPDELLASLTLPERQKVEIARLLYRGVKILLLDEPTALLLPQETEELFTVLREEASRGAAIVFVTHRLEEVFKIAERIVVLRAGCKVGQRKVSETTPDEIAVMMVGEVEAEPRLKAGLFEEEMPIPLLENATVIRRGERVARLKDFTLEVFPGAIHGVAGVAGNGQDEIFDLLAGVISPSRGRVMVKPGEIARVPGDRFRQGGIPDFTLSENVELAHGDIRSGFILNRAGAALVAKKVIGDLDVKNAGPETLYGSLSGGNAQKFLVGRELAKHGTPVTCLFNPTRGIDFASRAYLHSRIRAISGAVLLISYDLEELLELSDTITVLYRGESRGTFARGEIPRQSLASLMTGGGA